MVICIYRSYISNNKILNQRKKIFGNTCKSYEYDQKKNRLIKKILINKENGKEIYKNYYIAYEFEKFNIIRTLHDKCGHKGINTLYNLIRESDFYWSGIYNDIVNYVNKCKICQATHTSKYKSPINLQIISNKPKERYVVDITEIDENIRDKKYKFKYILNLIDHFT